MLRKFPLTMVRIMRPETPGGPQGRGGQDHRSEFWVLLAISALVEGGSRWVGGWVRLRVEGGREGWREDQGKGGGGVGRGSKWDYELPSHI